MLDKERLLNKIEMSLDTMRPYLKKDGGDIEIVNISDENILSLKFTGNCSTCTQSKITSAGIEEAIINYIPQIKAIKYVE